MAGMTLAEYRAAAAAIPSKTRKSQRKDQRGEQHSEHR
jgi:hypothetical protein